MSSLGVSRPRWEAISSLRRPTVGLASLRCALFRKSEAVGPRSVRAGGRGSRVEISGDLLSPYSSSQGSFPNGRAPPDQRTDFLLKKNRTHVLSANVLSTATPVRSVLSTTQYRSAFS